MSKLAGLLCFVALGSALAQQVMNNDSVTKMVKAGLSDDIVVQSINANPGQYNTSTDALIALKSAGVDDKVVGAIIAKSSGGSVAPPAAANAPMQSNGLPPGIDEVGVYMKDANGNWVALMPEVVNFKTGGFLKSVLTNGIIKQDINGHVPGATSKVKVKFPITFALYTPEGTAPTEYLLLRLRMNSDNREFRSMTGGVIHSSGGAQRDNVEFQAQKIAPRLYQFTLDQSLGKGEYGIMPPGSYTSSNMASGGKIYTVSVPE